MDKFDDAQNVKIGRALSLDGKCKCGFLKIFLHMFPHFKRRLILVAHINIDSIDQYCNAFSCTNTINISNYDKDLTVKCYKIPSLKIKQAHF